jgi:hypothetical protein
MDIDIIKLAKSLKIQFNETMQPIMCSNTLSNAIKTSVKYNKDIANIKQNIHLALSFFFGDMPGWQAKFDQEISLNLAKTEEQRMILTEIINIKLISENCIFGRWVYNNVPRDNSELVLNHLGYYLSLVLNNYKKFKDNLSKKNIGLEKQDADNNTVQFLTINYLYSAIYYCYESIMNNNFQSLFHAQTYLYLAKQEHHRELNYWYAVIREQSIIQKVLESKATYQSDSKLLTWIKKSVKVYTKKNYFLKPIKINLKHYYYQTLT